MTTTAPGYLTGLRAPVADEIGAVDLKVTGTLPAELNGRYFRNGPNPLPGADPGHWFAGAGMVHGVRLRDGRAEWYRNRWVETKRGRYVDPETGRVDLDVSTANTSVIRHAGRILALVESSHPYELTPELDTVGPVDFGGRLTTAMTAHPKEDPVTGELHLFGYAFRPPFLTYHRISASGELIHTSTVEGPGATMMHDFAITANHVVWLDLPVVFDMEKVGKALPFSWSDAYGARIGLMRHDGTGLRWFDVEPGYVFHVGNAFEDELGRVTLEAVRYTRESFAGIWGYVGAVPNSARHHGSVLHRWTVDPATGTVTETDLDDRDVEFPSIDEGRTGRPTRYLYAVTGGEIVKYDAEGAASVRDLGVVPGEAEFVPRPGATAEDDGWLLSIVTDREGSGSDLLVLDAASLETVAAVHLPRRVPMGFHGTWIND
ncbi:carotenoid cleavage dioxygenase [Actinorhabdospora filicis]|uniref:Dioxygenase n=1 Tax=Actinorhabdospora filicis TaxID=1785913 RepID=A0A9W6SN79_9ACTN|nr:carotenoid oxygenase family protein [Actinorhabdospora filicis]GLZ77666.1 carotenoid cleavage dioxygenase [Actinorhabdospora filicis]